MTPRGAPPQVFRFALAEVSGECSPGRETEGAEGGRVCPAYALGVRHAAGPAGVRRDPRVLGRLGLVAHAEQTITREVRTDRTEPVGWYLYERDAGICEADPRSVGARMRWQFRRMVTLSGLMGDTVADSPSPVVHFFR